MIQMETNLRRYRSEIHNNSYVQKNARSPLKLKYLCPLVNVDIFSHKSVKVC